MNYIYVVFLAPNTRMGKSIRYFTSNRYSHIAISLNRSITKMYSFARKKYRLPLSGGFIEEYPIHYFSTSDDIPLKISRVPVSSDIYTRLVSTIEDFKSRKDDMIYNSIDAVTASLLHKPTPIRDCFTCISFCCHLLGVRNIYTILELEALLQDTVIFEGYYMEYVEDFEYKDSSYFESVGIVKIIGSTFSHFGRLFARLIRQNLAIYI